MPDLHNGVMKGMGELRYKKVAGPRNIFVLCRNPHHRFCLDQQDLEQNAGLPVLVFDCHGEKGNQYW